MTSRRRIPRIHALAALLLAAAAPARAQEGMRPAGVDLGVGLGFGRGGGGPWHGREGVAAAATIAWRVRPAPGGALVVALGAGAQAVVAGGDDCLLLPGGGCAPDYPTFRALGLLGGWQAGRALRALVGPAVVHGAGRGTAAGLLGRVDLAPPPLARLALVAWGQGTVAPRLQGEAYRMASLGLGVRVR